MSGALGRALVAGMLAATTLFVGLRPAGPLNVPHPELAPPPVAAATPAPSLPENGDTRSPGAGPGFIGAPAVALGAVVAVGLVSALATLAYIRLTGGSRREDR